MHGTSHITLVGQHMRMGYGSRDIKVPARYIRKHMALFEKAGAKLEWYILGGQGHSL